MVDRDLVTRKLVLILEDLRLLGPVAARGIDAYRASLVDQAMTERLLERLIGRMIDINYHVLTDRELPPPPDYYQSFVQMGVAGVLDASFAHRLAACAGLRNRIAHDYDELDGRKVFAGLESAIRDVPMFAAAVRSLVDG